MSTENTYNGWTNYATWRVNLEICDDLCNSLSGDQTFADVAELADYLSGYVDELLDQGAVAESLALDYARSFVSDVDWYEIASHWTDELVEAEEEEEELITEDHACPDCRGDMVDKGEYWECSTCKRS